MSSAQKPVLVAPCYAAAAAFLLYALLFPLYRPADYAVAAAATVLVFVLALALCRSGAKKAAANAVQEEAPAQASAGQTELDKMMAEGARAVAEMKRLDENIADEKISADIVHLHQTSEKIFEYVRAHPDKLDDIHKFMNYYLPTTIKLLDAYDRMSAQGVSGENIDKTLRQIRDMMDTIAGAFDKQLDALFGAEALDISTDITVLENMMAREGLSGEQMKAERPAEETDIRLEL